ncbi:hypothetical protein RchiOBHm_Chr1g0333921 [Rosa chinensis]|uniref:Uncharacterized protein n=1 Tax=Rosa chinensis TaxID=74649 RepID=A0A2P6SC88_ROSCH|nr:hypothetical protein RchiOBHm_Chr1g0333921 [Rosa chinensis]
MLGGMVSIMVSLKSKTCNVGKLLKQSGISSNNMQPLRLRFIKERKMKETGNFSSLTQPSSENHLRRFKL